MWHFNQIHLSIAQINHYVNKKYFQSQHSTML